MQVCKTIAEIRQDVRGARQAGRTIGLVPTMGALHDGHTSLIDAAVADGHFVVATIFINPTQFGPDEDLASYPTTGQADLTVCERHGASAVFVPTVREMYPRQGLTTVNVADLTQGLCGRSRPSHFAGVCTVVAKLFNIVAPDAAYFGEKDAQQAIVLARMVEDLNFPIRLVVRPTVRLADGLAMSSRNQHLTKAQRAQAPQLHKALELAAECIARGQRESARVIEAMRSHLTAKAPLGQPDYVEIVDPETLAGVETIDRPVLVALAVRFGRARLIDNMLVDPAEQKA